MNRVTAVLIALVAAASMTTAPANARADEMTTQQAGRAYLSAVCIGNEARAVFLRKVWRGRERIRIAEVRVRLPQLKRLSGIYGRGLNKEARMLYNPEAGTWPASVARDVDRVATAIANESYWRSRQSDAANADAWLRFNGRANDAAAKVGSAPTRVRATLNLPPPGEGC